MVRLCWQEPADCCSLVALIIFLTPLFLTPLFYTNLALAMSLDGVTGPPASNADPSGEETADTATASGLTSALLDAVRAVVQQGVRAALAQPAGSEGSPAHSSTDSSLGLHPQAAVTAASQSGEELAVRP